MACTRMFEDASHALNKLSRALALLESENASLRGAVEGLGDSNDRYKAENAKLREYLTMACEVIDAAVAGGYNAADSSVKKMHATLKDLGIEVDELNKDTKYLWTMNNDLAHDVLRLKGEVRNLKAKNAKLKELADAVKEFVEDTHCENCPCRRECDDNNHVFCNDFSYHAFAAMRKLGIEVDG